MSEGGSSGPNAAVGIVVGYGVSSREAVGQVIFGRYRTVLVLPLWNVQVVLGAAAGEDRLIVCLVREATRGGARATVRRSIGFGEDGLPVDARRPIVEGVGVELEDACVMDGQRRAGGDQCACQQGHCGQGRQQSTASLLLVNGATQHDRPLFPLQNPLTTELPSRYRCARDSVVRPPTSQPHPTELLGHRTSSPWTVPEIRARWA